MLSLLNFVLGWSMTRAEQQLPWDFHCPSTSTVAGPPLSQQLHCHIPSTEYRPSLSQDLHCHSTSTVSASPLSHAFHCTGPSLVLEVQEATLGGQWACALGRSEILGEVDGFYPCSCRAWEERCGQLAKGHRALLCSGVL